LETVTLQQKLEIIQQRSIRYFLEQSHPQTGLVRDRALQPAHDAPPLPENPQNTMASVAATGYGFCAQVLAAEQGLIPREQAAANVLKALKFVEQTTPRENEGWLYHFVHWDTGAPYAHSEVSSVDTALFYFGALAAGEYFGGDVQKQVDRMLSQLNFKLMLQNEILVPAPPSKGEDLAASAQRMPQATAPDKRSFSHGFHWVDGQRQFIPWNWAAYSEGILLPLLAMGSTTHPVPDTVWSEGWDRTLNWRRGDQETFGPLPLFTYYYPLGYLPVKGKQDKQGLDLWARARTAVKLQQAYCQEKGYPDGLFGLSASDGPTGYRDYAPGHPHEDFTLAPPALLAALPLDPAAVEKAFPALEKRGLTTGRYGLTCAYNPKTDWRAPDALGIDVGSTMLMLDAAQPRPTLHPLLARSAWLTRALTRAGFTSR
jgi:hypothetical protein